MARGRRIKIDEPDYFGPDTPEDIRLCLACPRESCNNCIEYRTKKEKTARMREEETEGQSGA